MTLAVTGHRPKSMGLSYSMQDNLLLAYFAADILQGLKPDLVITGMALGWDQAVAAACATGGIPFVAAVPFPAQPSKWPKESRDRYDKLLNEAQDVYMLAPDPEDDYQAAVLMDKRNKWMVDNSGWLLALWNKKPGGTGNCVHYGELMCRPIIHVWNRWTQFRAENAHDSGR